MKLISGFWRRIAALIIDSLFLAIVGLGLGLVLEKQFIQLGGTGRLVGFFIALTYFGVMNSKITGGQTLGKNLLKIKVVDADLSPISIPRSFLRYCIFGIPFFLNGARTSSLNLPPFLEYSLSFLIIGGIFPVAYLYAFNRLTRQSVHDLITRTYVINNNAEEQNVRKIWGPHYFFAVVIYFAPVFVFTLTSDYFKQDQRINSMTAAHASIMKYSFIDEATVYDIQNSYRKNNSDEKHSSIISVQAFINQNSVSDVDIAKKLQPQQ